MTTFNQVAEKIIHMLDQSQDAIINIEFVPETFEVKQTSEPGREPPFITGFGGAGELAAILSSYALWMGKLQVSGIRAGGCYEFWIN